MKYIRFIFIIGLLILGGCKTYKPLEIGEPTNLKIESLSGNAVNLKVNLPISNPNVFKIKVTHMVGIASINDKKAGTFQNNEKVVISANSDEVHELSLKVDYSDLLSGNMSVFNILRTGKVKLSLKGTATAKSFLYRKELHFNKQRTLDLNK